MGRSSVMAESVTGRTDGRTFTAKLGGGAPIMLGLFYGLVEYFLISSSPLSPIFISPFPGYLYRAVYWLVLFLPFASRNYWSWFAKGALAMTVEDASYWAFYFWQTGGSPLQWAWYYPVWNSIPLLYLTLPVVLYSYVRGRRWSKVGLHHLQLVKHGTGNGSGTNVGQQP